MERYPNAPGLGRDIARPGLHWLVVSRRQLRRAAVSHADLDRVLKFPAKKHWAQAVNHFRDAKGRIAPLAMALTHREFGNLGV